ncbi:AraC family transcriptional regulator [Kluyvera sp. CHPC 1.251]|uniref:AraC family transcriptional regulator n=1 Tax=Kluyvera sp. CHPC 1.251 TaxID=2995175 RepID=UPI002FD8188D
MLDSPSELRDSTEMNIDPFSDILKLTRAESLVTGGFTAGGRWALRFPAPDKIKFFAILRGQCWVLLEGEPQPILFSTGDVGLLSAKRAFVLASDPEVEPIDAMSVFFGPGKPHAPIGEGNDVEHIGGHVLLNPTSGKLLTHVLPPWIHVAANSPQATSFRWLLDQLVQERLQHQPGSQLVSTQLAQLLFVQILRAHLQNNDALPAGWLRVLSDRRLSPALQLIHGEPARAWHLDELAKACAMSRTIFAQHFRETAGMTPIAYLTQWRMRLAEQALSEAGEQVAEVAQSLGYASVSAFSNAFKRETGLSPKAWRQTAFSAPGT